MSESGNGASAKVDLRIENRLWPADKELPLTLPEAGYIRQGYAVRPTRQISMDAFLELPG